MRAAAPTTRLGGHIVQGHLDGRGKFISAVESGGFWTVRIGFPREIAQYLVYKGSVSVEGISLTIATLTDEYFEIAVIPKLPFRGKSLISDQEEQHEQDPAERRKPYPFSLV